MGVADTSQHEQIAPMDVSTALDADRLGVGHSSWVIGTQHVVGAEEGGRRPLRWCHVCQTDREV